jgi:uncharacterized membrane protein (UPF0127 family)
VTRARAVTGAALALLVVAAMAVVVLVVTDSDDEAVDGAPRPPLRIAATTPAVAPFAGLTQTELSVGGRCRRVVVADTLPERVDGLTGRSTLGPYAGMLFVFGEPSTSSFTMAGVPVPLEIGFYAGDGSPVSRRHMKPCPAARAECPSYTAGGAYSYALETTSGELPDGALSSCS